MTRWEGFRQCPGCGYDIATGEGERSCSWGDCPHLPEEHETCSAISAASTSSPWRGTRPARIRWRVCMPRSLALTWRTCVRGRRPPAGNERDQQPDDRTYSLRPTSLMRLWSGAARQHPARSSNTVPLRLPGKTSAYEAPHPPDIHLQRRLSISDSAWGLIPSARATEAWV
jgi:hypothetical protein